MHLSSQVNGKMVSSMDKVPTSMPIRTAILGGGCSARSTVKEPMYTKKQELN